MSHVRLVLLLLVCIALPLIVVALPPPQSPGTFRLLAVHSGGDGIVDSAGLKYEIAPKRPPVPISMGGNLSPSYTRPKTSQIVFFEEITPPPPPTSATEVAPVKSPVIRHPRLSVTLPDDNLPYLIVVTKAPAGSPLPLIGRVFCSDAKTHPASSLRVINLSPNTAAAAIDSQTYEVGPYTSHVIALSPPESGNTKFLHFKFGSKENGDWSLILDESFRYRPAYRMYAIVLNIRAKDEERMKIFSERPPASDLQR